MPEVGEIYGFPFRRPDEQAKALRRANRCPFVEATCDGGGNRYQTGFDVTADHPLRALYDDEVSRVVPAVCSIDYGAEHWVVCPRRLFGFLAGNSEEAPAENWGLQPHERELLVQTSLPLGERLGVWPEVYLRFELDGDQVNYHFDYVIAPALEGVTLGELFQLNDIRSDDRKDQIIGSLRSSGLLSGKVSDDTRIPIVPRLQDFLVVEVMTASTSGSNTAKGTDIRSAFENAMLGRDHQSPGINKRQVWGRMATQLYAKSALAEAWDGEALWVVQDELLGNIEATTKLSLEKASVESGASEPTIMFGELAFAESGGEGGRPITLKKVHRLRAGVGRSDTATAADLLLPAITPSTLDLLVAILRRRPSAILRL